MTIRNVAFTSRQSAESLTGRPDMAIISITDPGTELARLAPDFDHVLRLSFFDAVPADEFIPAPIPGLFDRQMARTISDFIAKLHAAPDEMSIMVHCEYGVSRSAAIALFVEAYSGARLQAREFACDANTWVLDRLQQLHPGIDVDIPSPLEVHDRRRARRA